MLLTLFGDIERLAVDLYPYRFVVVPLIALVGAGAAYWLVRSGVRGVLWRHKLVTVSLGVPIVLAGTVLGYYLLSPLAQRSYLDEASPLAMAMPVESMPSAGAVQAMPVVDAPGFKPRLTHSGAFKGADDFHFGRGDAALIVTAPATSVLRFEMFSVRNGPDLYVYLSRDTNTRRVDESLNLGRLKATDGAFNYELPAGIDIASVKTVVVWCRQFGVLFAEAPLRPV